MANETRAQLKKRFLRLLILAGLVEVTTVFHRLSKKIKKQRKCRTSPWIANNRPRLGLGNLAKEIKLQDAENFSKLGFVDVIHPPVVSKINTWTPLNKQDFSYLLVLDFEATCWGDGSEKWRGNEIIEFPVVLLEVCSGRVVAEFHRYVRPTQRPVLAPFCVELTGIEQKTVDAGLPLQQCLDEFENWLTEQQERYKFTVYTRDDDTLELLRQQQRGSEQIAAVERKKAAFVTWTDWDIKTCLQGECKRKRMPLPVTFSRWIDLKSIFKTQCPDAPAFSLPACLEALGMKFTGRPHSGISDARNTAALAAKLMHEGAVLSVTGGVGGSIS